MPLKCTLWLVALVTMACTVPALAAETDQFMTWGTELKDSADVLNAQYNKELDRFIDKANRLAHSIKDPDEFTIAFYNYLSKGLYGSRYRAYIKDAPEVEKFPGPSVTYFEYYKRSIYRDPAFPFLLPMVRTIRIGDVYLGTDKIGHFLCYARRYFQRFQRYRQAGIPEDKALDKLILWGLGQEQTIVGGVVDGIVSPGDLEANYQGCLLARRICGGPNPYVIRENKKWKRVGSVDLREYITPDFDESYRLCRFTGSRQAKVARILLEQYAAKRELPEVKARFERYRQYKPSRNIELVDAYYRKRGIQLDFDSLVASVNGKCAVAGAKP